MEAIFKGPELTALLSRLRADDGGGSDRQRSRASRRSGGIYFTPQPLVDFVAESVLAALEPIAWEREGQPRLRILDPAAGDGRFIKAIAEGLAERSPGRGVTAESIYARCVAIERDGELARELARALPGATVHNREALTECADIGAFDIVVGNPPYIRSIRLGESDGELREALRGRYHATSHGEWDLYAAFIEQTLAWLRPRGHAGLVVPSRWLTARSASRLRAELARRQAISAIVDFGAEQLFDGATTYLSVAFIASDGASSVTVARHRDQGFEVGAVDSATLGDAPWRVSVGRGREIVSAMRRAGPPLGSLAQIRKGAGTNADSVFVIGEEIDVEAEIVRTAIRGRDVAGGRVADPSVRCIVPYDDGGALIAPETLRRRYPRAHRYLEEHRAALEARERGRFAGERFYQFGRPQNLALLLAARPKIVVPDVARQGRAMLDTTGALVLDSAYCVIPHDDADLGRLLAVLNSPAVAHWLRETGIPLRGGYVRMKTAYLESLPIAPRGSDLQAAYGLPAAEWS